MNVWVVALLIVVFNVIIFLRHRKNVRAKWSKTEKIMFSAFTVAMLLDVAMSYIFTSMDYLVEINPIYGTETPGFYSLLVPKVLAVFTVFHLLMYGNTSDKKRRVLLILANVLMWLIVLFVLVNFFISCGYGHFYG